MLGCAAAAGPSAATLASLAMWLRLVHLHVFIYFILFIFSAVLIFNYSY
jgi:hypothetical protein